MGQGSVGVLDDPIERNRTFRPCALNSHLEASCVDVRVLWGVIQSFAYLRRVMATAVPCSQVHAA